MAFSLRCTMASRAATMLVSRASSKPSAAIIAATTISRAANVPSIAGARLFSLTARARNQADDFEKEIGSFLEKGERGERMNEYREGDRAFSQGAAREDAAELKEGETPYAIFVRNISFDLREADMKEKFSKYGETTSVTLMRDARGLSRGYGFVHYTTPEAVNAAVQDANGMIWHGRRIGASPRTPRSRDPKRRTERSKLGPTESIYIGNIPYETTDAELNRLFRQLDNVTDVRVAVDRTTGWPRGFAHADFIDVESSIKAYEKLKGILIAGRELRLDYAVPRPKEGNRASSSSSAESESDRSERAVKLDFDEQ